MTLLSEHPLLIVPTVAMIVFTVVLLYVSLVDARSDRRG